MHGQHSHAATYSYLLSNTADYDSVQYVATQ